MKLGLRAKVLEAAEEKSERSPSGKCSTEEWKAPRNSVKITLNWKRARKKGQTRWRRIRPSTWNCHTAKARVRIVLCDAPNFYAPYLRYDQSLHLRCNRKIPCRIYKCRMYLCGTRNDCLSANASMVLTHRAPIHGSLALAIVCMCFIQCIIWTGPHCHRWRCCCCSETKVRTQCNRV